MRIRVLAAAAAALFAAPALLAAAPAPPDDGEGTWAAWYGCWRVEGEMSGPMVCVLPTETATSVRIATVEEGEVVNEAIVHADGSPRPVDEGGCTGEERAWFSSDGRRVFTRADLNCDGMLRVSTGVMGMIAEDAWVDAQSMKVGAEHASRAIRYRAVAERDVPEAVAALLPGGQRLALEAARLHAAAPLDIAAVIEMSRSVEAPAAEALLAARASGFGLDGRKLVQLADAGVPKSTIDMMVALSNPKRFAVAPAEPTRASDVLYAEVQEGGRVDACRDSYYGYYRFRIGDPCFNRYGYDRYGYGYYSGYRYSPWGYDPYYWNVNRPVVVIVRPQDPDGERTSGEVVKGRGYRRTTGDDTRTATPRATTTNTGSGSSSAVPASSTSSGSSSGSSTSEPRKAKPRGNNDQ
jgi:hypothetical protein